MYKRYSVRCWTDICQITVFFHDTHGTKTTQDLEQTSHLTRCIGWVLSARRLGFVTCWNRSCFLLRTVHSYTNAYLTAISRFDDLCPHVRKHMKIFLLLLALVQHSRNGVLSWTQYLYQVQYNVLVQSIVTIRYSSHYQYTCTPSTWLRVRTIPTWYSTRN